MGRALRQAVPCQGTQRWEHGLARKSVREGLLEEMAAELGTGDKVNPGREGKKHPLG